jgi:uncharacterized protein YegJ (DUF2314 family)
MRIVAALALLIFLAPCTATEVVAAADDPTVLVSATDPEMNAAIAKARASLGTFWREYESPEPDVTGFSLKVKISDGNMVEHFWLIDIKRDGDKLSGTINNDPEYVHTVKIGERYEFTDSDISDWMFTRRGKVVGNETARVLIKRLPTDEARQYADMFETQ